MTRDPVTRLTMDEHLDRAEIADTLNAYCDRVDRNDVDGLVDLFTRDAVMDMGAGAVFSGHRQLRGLMIDRLGRWTTTSHHSSTITFVRYDGQTATTVSYLYAFHDRPADDVAMHLWARYDDDLVNEPDRWRIRRRTLRVTGVQHARSTPLPDRFAPFERMALPTN